MSYPGLDRWQPPADCTSVMTEHKGKGYETPIPPTGDDDPVRKGLVDEIAAKVKARHGKGFSTTQERPPYTRAGAMPVRAFLSEEKS